MADPDDMMCWQGSSHMGNAKKGGCLGKRLIWLWKWMDVFMNPSVVAPKNGNVMPGYHSAPSGEYSYLAVVNLVCLNFFA
jgi:hypothetical protein